MIESSTYTSGFRGEDRTAGMTSSRAMMSDASKFSGMVDDASEAGETGKAADTKHKSGFSGFLSFLGAILDIINPLQHIPVISTIYRHITGDEISPMARVAGDALYGGPIGAAVGLADVAVESATGKDIGGNMMAMLSPDKKPGDAGDDIQVAANNNGQRLQDIAWNDAAPNSKPDGVLYADEATQNVQVAMAKPAPQNHDSQNALLAFARDMRAGGEAPQTIISAEASQEIDVTAAIRNDKPQGVLYARDDAAAENARLTLTSNNSNQQDFPSSPGPAPTKLSYRTGATGNGPAAYSYKDGTMVPTTKSGPAGSADIMSAQGKVNVKTALLSQEVTAASGENRAVPPGLIAAPPHELTAAPPHELTAAPPHERITAPPQELIAQRMMAGLDKYALTHRMQSQQGLQTSF